MDFPSHVHGDRHPHSNSFPDRNAIADVYSHSYQHTNSRASDGNPYAHTSNADGHASTANTDGHA